MPAFVSNSTSNQQAEAYAFGVCVTDFSGVLGPSPITVATFGLSNP